MEKRDGEETCTAVGACAFCDAPGLRSRSLHNPLGEFQDIRWRQLTDKELSFQGDLSSGHNRKTPEFGTEEEKQLLSWDHIPVITNAHWISEGAIPRNFCTLQDYQHPQAGQLRGKLSEQSMESGWKKTNTLNFKLLLWARQQSQHLKHSTHFILTSPHAAGPSRFPFYA